MARVMHALRSGPSRKGCPIRFVNRTSRKVNVIWLDFEGYPRNYGTLEPTMYFHISTYEGHPWICKDSLTMTRMLINSVEVYYPSAVDEEEVPDKELGCFLSLLSDNYKCTDSFNRKEEIIYITVPMLPLLKLAAETVAKRLHTQADITSLQIPTRLKKIVSSLLSNP